MSFRRVQFRKQSGRTPDILRKSHRHETIQDRIDDDHRWARRNRFADAMEEIEEDFDDDAEQSHRLG